MTSEDAQRWDRTWAEAAPVPSDQLGGAAPSAFVEVLDQFPRSGRALELACGTGASAVWLAERGFDVLAVDVSPIAVALAGALAQGVGLDQRCRFEVHDLDDGLPPGEPVDLLLCHMFRDPSLDRAIIDRLAPGGHLAYACLSEVGDAPGRFRAPAGALDAAFRELDIVASAEADGRAWLLARKGAGR